MGNEADCVELVRKAQLGDKGSVEELSQLAGERLREDVWRLTLDDELTEDIVQESLLRMLKMLSDLKEANRFWPWLYRIAINMIRQEHRVKMRRKTVPLGSVKDGVAAKGGGDAMAKMIGEELQEIVVRAMACLRPNHRAVLTMRCYREMGYSEIGEALGCSEFAAKMVFYRAKKSLKKQLGRYGFGKSSLLMALVLFGKLTSKSEAAVQISVAGASLKVGAAAGLAALATSKAVVVPVACAGALAVGTMVATSQPGETIAGPGQEVVRSLEVGAAGLEVSEGAEEYWYYFPERANGPVMMRMMKVEADGGQYCVWRQNEEDNYYYDKDENTVYVRNARMWRRDLRVWRLPTDSRELSDFISEVESAASNIERVRGRGEGLLVIARRGGEESNGLEIVRHYNMLEEEYFYYSFPVNAKVVDERDAMHRRGWTYFRVSGEIGGEEVGGTGRIPFVYAASERRGAWMRLRVGERRIVDGSFVGFCRPWMGLHAIDTVRRDAAKRRAAFETELVGGGKAEVKLVSEEGEIVYVIDMERDLVEKVRVSRSDGAAGVLEFEYLEEVDGVGAEFVRPRRVKDISEGLFEVLWKSK
jgi:RNA polymerase sigma-70 factor (ECF subfamily)